MRQITVSDEGADEFLVAMIADSIDTLQMEMGRKGYKHPDDVIANKKYMKALKRVFVYVSGHKYKERFEC